MMTDVAEQSGNTARSGAGDGRNAASGFGTDEPANLIADPHPPILDDYVGLGDVMAGGRKAPAEWWQHAAELRVDRVAIQTVRHDNLDARAAAVMQVRQYPNRIVRKNLAG